MECAGNVLNIVQSLFQMGSLSGSFIAALVWQCIYHLRRTRLVLQAIEHTGRYAIHTKTLLFKGMLILHLSSQIFILLFLSDLTPPQVRLSSNPQSVSQDTEWNFQFYCLNEHSCTYICSVHLVGSNSQYTTCSGTFYASGLLNGMNYEFSVIATDGVGNTGSPLTYNWKVGKN